MRITRIVAPICVVLALLVVTPAEAATTVVSHVGVPSPLYAGNYNLCDNTSVFGTTAHVPGPATPPLGAGSLRLSVPADQYVEFGRQWSGGPDSATAVSMSVFVPSSGTSHVFLGAWASTGGVVHEIGLTLPHNNRWTAYNLRDGRQLATRDLNSGVPSNSGSMTWSQWVDAYAGSAEQTYLFISVDTCDLSNAASAYVDKVHLVRTSDSTDKVFDMEPSLSNAASRSRTVSGEAVTLRSTLYGPDGPRSSQLVTLWSRPAGASSFSQVTEALTNDNGVASITQHPKVTTAYEWRFVGDETTPASASARRTIGVATALTLKVADTTLTAAQKLKAGGATTPVAKGATVKLWKQRAGADRLLAKTTTSSDGTWAIRIDLAKGRYDVYATVAATSKNVAGKSRTVTVTSA